MTQQNLEKSWNEATHEG